MENRPTMEDNLKGHTLKEVHELYIKSPELYKQIVKLDKYIDYLESNNDWVNIKDREPTIKDLPFVTYLNKVWELWEDSDWFQELSENERLEHKCWLPLTKPPKEYV